MNHLEITMRETRTTMQELAHLYANKEVWPNESLWLAAGGILDIFNQTGTLNPDYFETATSLVNLVNGRLK